MNTKEAVQTITAATPSSPATAAYSTTYFKGLSIFDRLVIQATITAGSGGTLDVYLQRKLAADSCADWIHFAQASAGATIRATATVNGEGSVVTAVGGGSDAAPGVALAAATVVNCIPGGDVRLVFVAGAGTSGAGSVTVSITPYTKRQ
jgi:hypothetical protein